MRDRVGGGVRGEHEEDAHYATVFFATLGGLVLNEKVNIGRREFDALKAILTNCLRTGPAEQNRGKVADFCSHLAGRIAHVRMVNPAKGEKLRGIFERIEWGEWSAISSSALEKR